MRRRTLLRWSGVLAVAAVGIFVAGKGASRGLGTLLVWQASRMNRQAWKATYEERGLAAPRSGPREGYWGARLVPHVAHSELGWILPELHDHGVLEAASDGMQRVRALSPGSKSLLIIGGSTAFGAYASDIQHTYFGRAAVALAAAGEPVDITVFAAGAWKSAQELAALRIALAGARPNVVIFLNGLNDLTNGSNANTLFGVKTRTTDGSRWSIMYNEHDYAERARCFLQNMRAAGELARRHGAEIIFVLQPALFEKERQSPVERRLEDASLRPLGSRDTLRAYYDRLRVGLGTLAREPGIHFVDASRAFPDSLTTFTDLWHFSDPGHERLASQLVEALLPILGRARGRK